MAAPHAGTHTEPRFVRRIQHKSASDVALHFRACAPSAPTKSMAYVTHPRTNCRRSVKSGVKKSGEKRHENALQTSRGCGPAVEIRLLPRPLRRLRLRPRLRLRARL